MALQTLFAVRLELDARLQWMFSIAARSGGKDEIRIVGAHASLLEAVEHSMRLAVAMELTCAPEDFQHFCAALGQPARGVVELVMRSKTAREAGR